MKKTRLFLLTAMVFCTIVGVRAQAPKTITLGVNDPQMGSVKIDDGITYFNNLNASSSNEMTIIDANYDEYSWHFSEDFGAFYTNNSDNIYIAANDYLVSPALTLKGGVEYTISIKSACSMPSYPERFEIKVATVCDATALNGGTVIIAATTVSQTQWQTYTGTFTPTNNGTYYIGIHAISSADMNELYVMDFTVTHPSDVIDNGYGTYSVPSGTEVTVSATPETCYALASWSNGAEVNTDGTTTFTVTDDMTLTATFESLTTTGDTTAIYCDQSLQWHDSTYTATPDEDPTYTTTNAAGCDSVITLHLTINHSTTGDTTATAIDSFTWHGTTYTSTPEEDPSYTTTNAAGCDSIVTLHLTIGTNDISSFGSAHASLAVFPNPAVGGQQVRITLNGIADLQGALLAIYDLQSRKVIENPFSGTCSVSLPAGIYILRLTLSNGIQSASRLIIK